MDTTDLGAGCNPCPDENEFNELKGTVVIELNIKDEFPNSWDKEMIIDYIKDNVSDYLERKNIERIVDIDI